MYRNACNWLADTVQSYAPSIFVTCKFCIEALSDHEVEMGVFTYSVKVYPFRYASKHSEREYGFLDEVCDDYKLV